MPERRRNLRPSGRGGCQGDEERLKWQKVRMRLEDIAWIEEASKALE
jgi:hypothetical protein